MSTGEKKPTATTPPSPTTSQQPTTPSTSKKPLVSRRTFLKAAVGVSTALAAASMTTSGQILGPLIPQQQAPLEVANALDLENDHIREVTAAQQAGRIPNIVSRFFSWPYTESESPYYKNILARLPDELIPESDRGSTPMPSHYVSWNLTCVHLRCIVNPGRDDNEYRLICPCHGSQYRLTDAVPVKGPAFFSRLRPLPKIRLRLDSENNIITESFEGEPGVGRTTL